MLGAATQSMITGAICDPCWVVAGVQSMPSGWPDGLSSIKSIPLLRHYSGGAVAHSNYKGMAGQLIVPELLCVLWSTFPDSYFFAFPKGGVLQAVKATPSPYDDRCGQIPADSSEVVVGAVLGLV